jgi:MarR family transcriptional regulator, transcriptional regulator for hemolysin
MTTTKNTPTLGFLLHDVARLLRKRFEQNARGSGLTRSQWQVLAYLSWNDGIHQNGLAELLDVEPITLGRIVDKLEGCGLVERHPHPTDRRVHLLRLTAAAGPKLALMQELGDITRGEALAGVSEAERARLMEVLQHLRSNLVEACDAPAATHQRASAGHE